MKTDLQNRNELQDRERMKNESAITGNEFNRTQKQENEFNRTEPNCIKNTTQISSSELIYIRNYMQEMLRK
jgi:hypothetical protein